MTSTLLPPTSALFTQIVSGSHYSSYWDSKGGGGGGSVDEGGGSVVLGFPPSYVPESVSMKDTNNGFQYPSSYLDNSYPEYPTDNYDDGSEFDGIIRTPEDLN